MKSSSKIGLGLVGMMLLIASMVPFMGCTPQQVQFVAQQAGLASVATWCSVDNPSEEVKKQVKGIVDYIGTIVGKVDEGQSYYVVLYPDVVKYIEKNVPAQSQLLCKLGAGWILTGIDGLFAMHPEWGKKQVEVGTVVKAFLDGASMALSMGSDHKVMKAFAQGAEARNATLKAMK